VIRKAINIKMNNPNGAAIGLGSGARANTRAVGVTGSMVRNILLTTFITIIINNNDNKGSIVYGICRELEL